MRSVTTRTVTLHTEGAIWIGPVEFWDMLDTSVLRILWSAHESDTSAPCRSARFAVIRQAREVSGNIASTCRYYGISRPTFYTWARRLDLNRLPNSQRYQRHEGCWKRYEKQQPGHRIQIDVKFIAP